MVFRIRIIALIVAILLIFLGYDSITKGDWNGLIYLILGLIVIVFGIRSKMFLRGL